MMRGSLRQEGRVALITYLTRIQFDFGALKLLEPELKLLGMTKPLLVTDRGVVAAGLANKVEAALPAGMPLARFQDTPANPTEAAARAAVVIYRDQGCDGVIALGGGSAIDLGKAVALWVTHGGTSLMHYALIEGGLARIGPNVAPLVAIPTTAGTGSEVGRGALIILDDGRKLGLISPHLIPKLALCDPELTFDLPPALTAGTGLDAIAHCIETYLSPQVNPPAEAIALDGLGRAWAHLERAVRDGHDKEARWQMMMAAMEGAMAFQKGLGAVHALSHPLGALPSPSLHHGTLNALFLPPVIRFNAPAIGAKLKELGRVMGVEGNAEGVARAIEALNRRLQLPPNLKAMGVPAAILANVAENAPKDHSHNTNPRPATVADYRAMLEAVYG
jgi:alcohol dehydrogenase class IV